MSNDQLYSQECSFNYQLLPVLSEQLFTCKQGGRKPNHLGKLLTYFMHFTEKIIFHYFLRTGTVNKFYISQHLINSQQCRILKIFRFKVSYGKGAGRVEGRRGREGIRGEGEGE